MSENTSDFEVTGESSGLIVYCRSWCPDCRRALAWLDERDIPYTVVDVDDNRVARTDAESLNDGELHTPTFKFGDGVCVDFRPDRLKELLDID